MKRRVTGRGWATIVICLLTLTMSLAGSFWLVHRLAYLLALMLVLSYVWARLNIGWLEIERRGRATRAQLGEEVEEQFTLWNSSWLPKLWLELKDQSTLPGHRASTVVSMSSDSEMSWTVRTRCVQRGHFRLGPLELTTGDPFGLFRWTSFLPLSYPVVVYPKVVPLPAFSLDLTDATSASRTRRDTRYVTPTAAGVRDYAVGDSFSRIHWPTTAHLGKLMVKEFEHYPTTDIWLLLDLEERVQAGEGIDSTEEYAVTVVASLASRLLGAGSAVGFAAYGGTKEVLPPEPGARQQIHILEALATLQARGSTRLETMIQLYSRRFTKQTRVVAVSAAPRSEWMPTLHLLDQRGVRCQAIALESDSFQTAPVSKNGAWDGGQVPTYVLRKGDDLAKVLNTEGY